MPNSRLGQMHLLFTIAMVAGCATLKADMPSPGTNVDVAGTRSVERELPEPYVLLQPDATGLRAVASDGTNTFLEFSILVPPELRVFDGEGKRLETAASGNLLGVGGLHQGLLLRLGTATTYVGVRPGQQRQIARNLPDSTEIRAVRATLVTQSDLYKAMQRAIQKIDDRTDTGLDVETRAATGTDQTSRAGRVSAPAAAISPLLRRWP